MILRDQDLPHSCCLPHHKFCKRSYISPSCLQKGVVQLKEAYLGETLPLPEGQTHRPGTGTETGCPTEIPHSLTAVTNSIRAPPVVEKMRLLGRGGKGRKS